MVRSVMVDIETLSTRSDACVISIGLAEFVDGSVTRTDGIAIHHSEWHGHIDPQTVKWWMGQSPQASEYSFEGGGTAHAASSLLIDYLEPAKEVWANSPQFDLTILRSWWSRLGMGQKKFPAHYRVERDCRTIFNEARRMGIELGAAWAGTSVAHNPIDDAANQARAIIEWRRRFPGGGL